MTNNTADKSKSPESKTTTKSPEKSESRFGIEQIQPIAHAMYDNFYFTLMNYADVQNSAATMYFQVRLPVFVDAQLFTEDLDNVQEDLDNAIYRFMDILESKLALFNSVQTTTGMRNHRSELGYIWLREQRSESDIIYHVILLTSQDARFYLADNVTKSGSMGYKIAQHWCEALRLDPKEFYWLTKQSAKSSHTYTQKRIPDPIYKLVGRVIDKTMTIAQICPEAWDAGLQMFGSSEPKLKIPNQR